MAAFSSRWFLFKAWLRSWTPRARTLERQYGFAASQLRDSALAVVRKQIAGEKEKLEELWPHLGYRMNDRFLFELQLPFLWGLFHEAVADAPKLPTNGYDKITILMMTYLMKDCDMTLE